jgi:hypothetical protein
MPIRLHLKRYAVEIEATEEVVVTVPIVLIPKNAPLREEMGAV